MAYIKVDHSEFSKTASAVDNYVGLMKRKMIEAQNEIDGMSAVWEGADFTQFRFQWSKVTNGESVYNEMLKSLETYSKFLKYAAEKYKDTQSRAVNRANALPRW